MREYDVIVCGGGTAGAAAGIKSARLGAKTLVVEQMSALGGTQSMGWVTPMMPNYLDGRQLSGGINTEIQSVHAQLTTESDFPNAQVWYNPAALSLALEKMADEAGLERLYCATLFDSRLENGRVKTIRVAAKGGTLELAGKFFVDATGDAELAHLSGVPTESGDASGINQPMTLRFTVGGVDIPQVAEFFADDASPAGTEFLSVGYAEAKNSNIGPLVCSAIADGYLNDSDLGYFQFFTMLGRPRELAFNCPRITGYNPLEPFEYSKAVAAGREMIFRIHAFCVRYLPGFKNSYVSVIAPMLGIRESRRIIGEYVLTEEDHQTCRKFPDAIARNRYPIDIHLASGGVELKKLPKDDYHEIPYRSLVPKKIENMLVAGRCFSATFVAQSSARIQPVCRAMGEAAGAAAAICAAKNIGARELDYDELRRHLDLSVG